MCLIPDSNGFITGCKSIIPIRLGITKVRLGTIPDGLSHFITVVISIIVRCLIRTMMIIRYLSTIPYCQGPFMIGLCIRSDGHGICSFGSVITFIPFCTRIKGCIVKYRFFCYFFQLRHIGSIRICCTGSYVSDLTGIITTTYGKCPETSFKGCLYRIFLVDIDPTGLHRSLYYDTFLFIFIFGNSSSIGYTIIPDRYPAEYFDLCRFSQGYTISCRT